MLLIAFAYRYLNQADPDCGTTFAWATRAMGPSLGWIGGWVIVMADVIVMANLAQIAGIYTFLLFRWDAAAASTLAVTIVGVLWIVVMTIVCYIGIELSARIQNLLLAAEVVALGLFAVVALATVYIDHPPGSIEVGLSWFNPFAISSWSALINGVLLGLFIYWGWDSAVSVNEESKDSATGPGKAAVVSTLLLVGIYVVVATAAQAYAGPAGLIEHQDDVLSALGGEVLPAPLDLLLVIAVLTSASASTQTTILPTTRTTLSMARWGALHQRFAAIHPRFQTPSFSTILMGIMSVAWFVLIVNISTNVLADSITALGFLIAFYYGMTGFACAIYYRHELRKSTRNLFLLGILPFTGGLLLLGIFFKALVFYGDPANTSSNGVLGIGAPVVIGIGSMLLGVVVMLATRPQHRAFFNRRTEVADPAVLAESTA